jgi:diguanylate cyclase (GGDEF)-like protein/PAS domain S-box-containing protein
VTSNETDPAFLLETLLRHTPDFVYFKDRDSRFLALSDELARFFAHDPAEIVGKTDSDLVTETFTLDLAHASREAEEAVMSSGEAAIDIEESRPLPDGTPRWVSATKIPLRDRNGAVIGTFGMSRDITARKLAEEQVRAQVGLLARFEAMYVGAAIGIVLVDRRGRVVECNPALCEMLGYSEEELIDRSLNDHSYPADITADAVAFDQLVHGERNFYRLEKRYQTRSGAIMWGHLAVSLVRDAEGEPQFAIEMIENITARKEAEDKLRAHAEQSEYQALHDSLTGLPNRVLFADRLQQAALGSARSGSAVVVLMVDLDGFKEINDLHGHHAGDLVLQAVAERLGHAVRSSDTVGRLGGDEFGIVLPEWVPSTDIAALVEKLEASVGDPIDIGEVAVRVGASIGVASYPGDGDDLESVLRKADAAMYEAKRGRAGRSQRRSPPAARASLVDSLHDARPQRPRGADPRALP